MNNTIIKRIVISVLVFSLLASAVYASEFYDGGNPFWSGNDWENYKDEQGLGAEITETIDKDGVTLTFNKELWDEQKIVVYGDHSLIALNDEKVVDEGYYSGYEYRYEGFDISGNLHVNDRFPRDSDSGRKLSEKSWVYRPWDEGSIGHRIFDRYVGAIPDYNKNIIDGANEIFNADDIIRAITLLNEGSVFSLEKVYDSNYTSRNMHDYQGVNTAPTAWRSGVGTMVHISNDGNDWYQSMSITRPTEGVKLTTPITADIPFIETISINTDGDITLEVHVSAKIEDDAFYNDDFLKTTRLTRDDLDTWGFELRNNITGNNGTMVGTKSSKDVGTAIFSVSIPQSSYKDFLNDEGEFEVTFSTDAYAKYKTGDISPATASKVHSGTGTSGAEQNFPIEPFVPIEFDVVAPIEILDVWNFPVSLDITNNEKEIDRYVELNGVQLSDADESKFLTGNWKFPEVGEDRIYEYTVTLVHEDGDLYWWKGFVVVYDSVPRASVQITDPAKVNRKFSATSDDSNAPFLEANSTISITNFSLSSPDGKQIYMGEDTLELKEFLLKEEGTVDISVTVGNEYGSRSYTHQVYAGVDHDPDIVAMVWSANMSRMEELDMFAEGASLDGDTVGDVTYEIKYDTDDDGVGDSVVDSGVWSEAVNYVPTTLGFYDITLSVTESFGQATIEEHIVPEDYKTTTIVREFFVDNLVPMTKLYTDIEYSFPELDVMILGDEDITREQSDWIRNNNVDITNDFRVSSIVADVDYWDLHTYVYSQTAYDRYNSGRSYPSNTRSYNSGGYSGTLNLTNVDNYRYSVDEGRYRTRTLSKYATASRSSSGSSSQSNNLPSSVSYSSGGYSGTLSQTSYTYNSGWVDDNDHSQGWWWTRRATYGGTVTKKETYWDSDWNTYDNYYGDYSGTVYKYVKQDYTPSLNAEANQFIVYIADDSINNNADLEAVKDIAREATLVVVGDNSLRGTLGEDYFYENTGDIETIIDDIIAQAKVDNPIANERAILVGETYTLNTIDLDAEGDPITEIGYQVVHEPTYLDNSQGYEVGTYSSHNDSQYAPTVANSFSKSGKYYIHRKIKDEPIGFAWLGKESNVATHEIVVHRKPIASAVLDWDYDNDTSSYKTAWVDQSYDLDFETDANKGIVDRSIRYRDTSTSTWIYEIPDNLVPASYELEYLVMDKHGVWSDPEIFVFTLEDTPPIQFDANLGTERNQPLTKVSMRQNIVTIDAWTRFPYGVHLELQLLTQDSSSSALPLQYHYFTEGVTGEKNDNDILWYDINYFVDDSITEGWYTFRVTAVGSDGQRIYKEWSIYFVANTPPDATISIAPVYIYESDDVVLSLNASDPDLDDLSIAIDVYNSDANNIYSLTDVSVADGSNVYSTLDYTIHADANEGKYTVVTTVSDPLGEVVTINDNYTVFDLMVDGTVGHVDEWNENRISFNQNKTGTEDDPRPYNVFWSGERFVIKADSSVINPLSSVNCDSVFVSIIEEPYSTSLTSIDNMNWSGEIWDETMINRWGRAAPENLTFRFTATYSNGAVKTDDVIISIDSQEDFYALHRIF